MFQTFSFPFDQSFPSFFEVFNFFSDQVTGIMETKYNIVMFWLSRRSSSLKSIVNIVEKIGRMMELFAKNFDTAALQK